MLSWLLFAAPSGVQIAEDAGSAADWFAALGTWVIGYGAAAIAWRAGQRQEQEQENDREKSRRDELASLFGVLSIARRSVDAAEDAKEYFNDSEDEGLPHATTLWVLGRLISRLDEIRGREIELSVLSEGDQEIVFDLEEEASWLKAVAMDLTQEINSDDDLEVKDHFAVKYLLSSLSDMHAIGTKLVKSTTDRRAELA
ncbi:hypothetical protein [Stenotrophomonas indicatrix]|uniref:hypothetical protein n=1 Tax=Stenotrophomonas indicatrix TaxID=2045451 RepID=UPI000FDABCDE|nr:hypothetical protein [Stenotrophomonas indicatrix]